MKTLEGWKFRDTIRAKQPRREHGKGNFVGDVREKKKIKPRNSVFCPAAGKHKMLFMSKGEALRFIEYNADDIERENGSAPRYTYYCDICCGWHISSHRLPNGYKSKARQAIGEVLKNMNGLQYCKRVLKWLKSDIESVEKGDYFLLQGNLPTEVHDKNVWNGFLKRHNRVVAYFGGSMNEVERDELLNSLRKYRVHVEKYILQKFKRII